MGQGDGRGEFRRSVHRSDGLPWGVSRSRLGAPGGRQGSKPPVGCGGGCSGLLLIHDAHLNEDQSGPLPVAKYSALLMHSTQGKCYSVGEIRKHLDRAGFREMRFLETAADRSVILARKPA